MKCDVNDPAIQFLLNGRFKQILGMILPEGVPKSGLGGLYTSLDIVFIGQAAEWAVVGKDHLLKDQTDEFSLKMCPFVREGCWDSGSGWLPILVADENSHQEFLIPRSSRKITFYTDDRFKDCESLPQTVWDRTVGMVIQAENHVLGIFCDDFPFNVVHSFNVQEIHSLVKELEVLWELG